MFRKIVDLLKEVFGSNLRARKKARCPKGRPKIFYEEENAKKALSHVSLKRSKLNTFSQKEA